MVWQADKRIDWRAKKGRDESRPTEILFAVFDQLLARFETLLFAAHLPLMSHDDRRKRH